MYNLLIVDDEEVAIQGILRGIDWSTLPVGQIFTAYDAEEAKLVYRDQQVHVMVSDIDMPRENGIALLDWVNAHSPRTATIFLTGHANFTFAQQAVQLGSFDYLLKPIDHDKLKNCVAKAIRAVQEREEEAAYFKTYEYYYDQWKCQLPLLVERLWQDVFHLRISATAEQLEPLYKLYGVDLAFDQPILPLLISIEEWKKEWSARDEEIMTYALKNAASELLLGDHPGQVIQERNGMLFVLLYRPEAGMEKQLKQRCEEYIRKCSELLYVVVSCYIGESVQVGELRTAVHALEEMERANVCQMGKVQQLADDRRGRKMTALAPNLQEWAALLEHGKAAELRARIDELFDRLRNEQIDHTYMVNYYFGLVHVVFQLLQRRQIAPGDIYAGRQWRGGENAMKSLKTMRAWTLEFTGLAVEHLGRQAGEVSQTVASVKRYIQDHLQTELNREAVAAHVYLNPAYLSRLFRKETGQSLTDYLVDVRMARAKSELERTNVKISDIALSVGYCNFSHFSKLFKKMTGLTPHEYRKKFHQFG